MLALGRIQIVCIEFHVLALGRISCVVIRQHMYVVGFIQTSLCHLYPISVLINNKIVPINPLHLQYVHYLNFQRGIYIGSVQT